MNPGLDLLAALLNRPEWHAHANCRGHDVDEFFPEDGTDPTPEIQALCNDCPVRLECLETNLHEIRGWYGGSSPHTRRLIRAKQARHARRSS